MALMAAGIGAVGSIAGGLLGGKPKTPKYSPYDVTSGLGTVDYTKGTKRRQGSISLTLSPEQQAYAALYGGLSNKYLGDQSGSQYMQQAGGMIPGLFNGQLAASGVDYNSLAQYQQQMMGGQNAMQGIFGGAYGAGMNALNSPIVGSQQANQMFGMGQNLMGQNYNDVYQNRLGLLRQQAQPFEDRAMNSFLTRQHAMGRMGSTGGQNDVQAFATGIGQADTTRQLDAMNLSEALYGRDQATGQSLMANGMQGLFQGYGAQSGAAQGFLGLGGTAQGALAGMFGNQYGASQGMNELVNQRAQQRMANATNLFGFGNDLNLSNLQTGQGLHGNQVNLYNQLQNNANMGHQSGVGTASAQAAAAAYYQPNVLGSALQGFGNAVAANPSGFAGMFSGQPTVGLSPQQLQSAYASIPQFNFPGFGG